MIQVKVVEGYVAQQDYLKIPDIRTPGALAQLVAVTRSTKRELWDEHELHEGAIPLPVTYVIRIRRSNSEYM